VRNQHCQQRAQSHGDEQRNIDMRMPAKLCVSARAIVTAGLANQ